MRKWIKYIITGIIAIVFCVVYAYIDKAHNIYDTETDNSAYVAANVEGDSLISQTFKCQEANLDGLAAKVVVNSTSAGGKLTYLLEDAEGQEVIKGEVPISDIKSGRINKVKFDERIKNCKEKIYTVSFSASGLNEGESIGVYYDPIGKQAGSLKVNGEEITGTLIFRTITHKFDIETFIMTLGFIIYFVVFFRILYKLFS
ncbi:hypothetical protein ACQRBN_02940 [Bariatricus sp. SGI.154]|uniref:hypothetical protein n=1 Tax=Bariatricus sp. SGI.154 TaxID=3420549 RepID=UPI003D06B050